MSTFPYHRIVVIGTTSSGKSTLAERLGAQLGMNFIELDALHWESNWQKALFQFFAPVLRERRKPNDGSSRGIIMSCAIWSGQKRKPSFGWIIRCGGSSGNSRAVPSHAGGLRNYFGVQTENLFWRT